MEVCDQHTAEFVMKPGTVVEMKDVAWVALGMYSRWDIWTVVSTSMMISFDADCFLRLIRTSIIQTLYFAPVFVLLVVALMISSTVGGSALPSKNGSFSGR